MGRQSKESAPSAAKQALVELKRMQAKLDAAEHARTESIAICGMGLRFPGGVNDANSYWQLLSGSVDAITEIPPSRWDVDELYDPDPAAPGKMYSRHGGFIDDVDAFDAEFFGLSPREAVSTDPQQRLLLEVSWEALENAAIAPSSLARSRSGVFIGMGNSDYSRMLIEELEGIDAHTGTGGAMAVASGRLSYALGLNGPSLVIDTACSSSLTAMALACESLRRRECDLALAGGSNLILTPEYNIAFSKAGMLAPDGRCKTFDARADGYVRGEGCAVVVLKRLSDALQDNDPILAVVRGFAVNQDGASSGLTVPKGPAQEDVVRDALQSGGVTPNDVDYVEAHGTATSLGDPIEVHALGAVFADRPSDNPLLIGSVKTNVGHLEAAAGIASVIKVVLALQHRQIPATLHFEEPSPQIDWSRCPVKVVTDLTDWSDKNGNRIAGISSFGFSGTNAHVILEQAPQREAAEPGGEDRPTLLTLSAKAPAALCELAARYAEHVERETTSLADIAWSANVGRSHLSHRLAIVASGRQELHERLAEFSRSGSAAGCYTGQWFESGPPPIAMLFAGDGSQLHGMGREYYEQYPVFRGVLDECDELLRPNIEYSLIARLYESSTHADWSEPAAVGQPALFALQVALARLWQSWGVEPTVVLGQGLGEYAAACVAGVFDLHSGLELTAARGRLFDKAETVALVAVSAGAEALSAACDKMPELFIAAENSPESTVVAGDTASLEKFTNRQQADGVGVVALGDARLLIPMAGPEREQLEEIANGISYSIPGIEVASGRYGRCVDKELCDASAWVPQGRVTAPFWPGMQYLREEGMKIFLEISPQPVLAPMSRQAMPGEQYVWLSGAQRGKADDRVAVDALATLYAQGIDVNWGSFVPQRPQQRIALPTYPFQRESYWWKSSCESQVDVDGAKLWDNVVAAGQRQAGLVPIEMNIDAYADKWRHLDELTNAYLIKTFRSLGVFTAAGETHTADSLVETAGIKPVYKMLMSRWLGHLTEAGCLERHEESFTCARPPAEPDIDALLAAAEESLSDIPQLMDYIRRCGHMLEDILLDRESALQTLFPGGATDTAQFLYRDWAAPRYFNEIAAAVVERFVNALPRNRRARLIEIGAGTGATTSYVLPRLEGRDLDYFFTDVSDYFLSQASEEFAGYPFVRYGLLDIGESPEQQGYGEHQFDVVIAANVLHATSNLETTIDQVLSLLAPGGMLVLYETTGAPRWSDMTVSLIEGWQSFADSLRTDSPLLSSPQWSRLLQDRGFSDVVELPNDGSCAAILGSHIIIAHVDDGRELSQSRAEISAASAVGGDSRDAGTVGTQIVDPAEVARLRQDLDEVAPNERMDLLIDYVRSGVNRVLRRNPDKPLDRRQRLMDLGVDSLMAVELRNVLTVGLGLDEPLPATLIFDHPTVEAVARFLDTQLAGEPEPDATDEIPKTAGVQAMSEAEIDELSDEQIKAALRAKIGGS
jgi:acyl transferase domain-containing protein/SAM-dependent methyltransferase